MSDALDMPAARPGPGGPMLRCPRSMASAAETFGASELFTASLLCTLQAGLVRVLFVSPERLGNPHLLDALGPHMPLPLVR